MSCFFYTARYFLEIFHWYCFRDVYFSDVLYMNPLCLTEYIWSLSACSPGLSIINGGACLMRGLCTCGSMYIIFSSVQCMVCTIKLFTCHFILTSHRPTLIDSFIDKSVWQWTTVHHFFQRVCVADDAEVTSRPQTVHVSEPQNNDLNPEECVSDIHLPHHIDNNSVTEDNSARKHNTKCSYTRDVCKKPFMHQSTSKIHLSVHTGERPFSCDLRKKRFTQRRQLNCHLHEHNGEQPYSCDMCKKSFACRWMLKIHLRFHVGERPFSCDMCNKRFTQHSHLTRHLRIHTGERPYSCDVCNKSFTQRGHLNYHLRDHNGERPYSCDMCNKRFTHCSHLTRHLRIHTGE
jgi:hypothetical protein